MSLAESYDITSDGSTMVGWQMATMQAAYWGWAASTGHGGGWPGSTRGPFLINAGSTAWHSGETWGILQQGGGGWEGQVVVGGSGQRETTRPVIVRSSSWRGGPIVEGGGYLGILRSLHGQGPALVSEVEESSDEEDSDEGSEYEESSNEDSGYIGSESEEDSNEGSEYEESDDEESEYDDAEDWDVATLVVE
ncbi:hypothetical protein VTK26DRAFT_5132 [Humicola hyalothermophila]